MTYCPRSSSSLTTEQGVQGFQGISAENNLTHKTLKRSAPTFSVQLNHCIALHCIAMSTMIPVADFEQQQQHLVLVIEKIKSSSNLHFHICTLLSDRLNLVVTWWWLNESWGLPTRPKLPSATASPSYFLSATSNSPPQPHECVDSPLARSPAGKSGLKLLHTSWGSAECVPIYGHPPLLLAPRTPQLAPCQPKNRTWAPQKTTCKLYLHSSIWGGRCLILNSFQTRV